MMLEYKKHRTLKKKLKLKNDKVTNHHISLFQRYMLILPNTLLWSVDKCFWMKIILFGFEIEKP